MFSRHVSRQLAAHLDGELTSHKAQQVELHVAQCELCRADREQVRLGMEMVKRLPTVEAPDAIWVAVEAALEAQRSSKLPAAHGWRLALAATAALILLALGYWTIGHPSRTHWDVVRVDGSPTIEAKQLRGAGKIGAGEWIETDAVSSARLRVGKIGSVEVEPNTRLRVVAVQPGEHRLALERGEIRAKITAPPRLFFVDTASGTAVDLGCEYKLDTNAAGFGMLQVTKGWVSFGWKGLESLVPAGASCQTRPQLGPGVPYFDDASESMQRALERFSFEKDGGALNLILTEARMRDTLTLWHLLSRVAVEERPRVYDRIASLTPVPAGVARDQALKLDPETLKRWKEELAWTW